MKVNAKPLQAEYARLRQRLARVGWMPQGYRQDRGPGAGGLCYQWTRKVQGKTVSVPLSKEQFQSMQAAIANRRQPQDILQRMQGLSGSMIFGTLADTRRRKRLTKKVLGIN